MKKLILGIVEFRKNLKPTYRETFARLALGQSPDSLFIACSDSRVVPNLFASTDPGDLFVIRNVGNMIPPCETTGHSSGDESEAAAIEFALSSLKVENIIICGHSECGAIQAVLRGRDQLEEPNLKSWLRLGEPALGRLQQTTLKVEGLAPHNALSQLNVLTQLAHLKSYPLVKKRLDSGNLTLHAWWFDIAKADVYAYEETENRFVIIDEAEAEKILKRLDP